MARPQRIRGVDGWYRVVNALGRLLLRVFAVRVDWRGAEHLPRTGPAIVAANHVSFLDFVLLERVAITRGRYLRFLCRHDMWAAGGGLLGFVLDRMGHVPVDRDSGAGAYLRARRLLHAGEAVGIFPEGWVSPSYTVRRLLPGAVALARDTGAPLVPAAVWGGQRILTAGHGPDLTRGRRVSVVYGEPLHVAPDADLRATTELLGARLTELLEGLQRSRRHRPRAGQVAPWHPAHLGGQAPSVTEAVDLVAAPRGSVAPTWGPAAAGPHD